MMKRSVMAKFILVLTLIISGISPSYAGEKGKLLGGMAHEFPQWFKDSFLDLKEDAQEAAESGKHTIIFMSLNGCPYCTRMLNVTFKENRTLIEKDFESIGINIKGDREMVIDGDKEMTEKQFARKMRVRFTPTILFLDENAKPIFRINGYWDPAQFRVALAYVRSGAYKTTKITRFMKERANEKVWNFAKLSTMSEQTDLSGHKKPLLVLFEDAGCTICAEVHKDLLSLAEVEDVLKTYEFVRFDSRSDMPIIDYQGNKTTAQKWAAELGVSTSPTFIAFDEGEERQRFDGLLYSHHLISILKYVSGKHYKTYDNWLRYNSERTKEVLDSGKDVDLSDGRSGAKGN